MKKIKLNDDTPIYCLRKQEALVLDEHIKGYISHGIKINKGDTIIDIGANIGVFGTRLSQMYDDIYIHCFEPIPEIYDVLKKNSQLSANTNFKTYRMGLSDKNTDLVFTYYPNSPALSTAQPKIWEKNQKNLVSAVHGNIVNAPKNIWWAKFIPTFITPIIAKYLTLNSKNVKCKVITLSHFINQYNIHEIKLLKIDCEGEEINVLNGLENSDWPKIQNIVMEVNDIENNIKKAKKILLKHGFKSIQIEKEKGFEKTKLVNIYAKKFN